MYLFSYSYDINAKAKYIQYYIYQTNMPFYFYSQKLLNLLSHLSKYSRQPVSYIPYSNMCFFLFSNQQFFPFIKGQTKHLDLGLFYTSIIYWSQFLTFSTWFLEISALYHIWYPAFSQLCTLERENLALSNFESTQQRCVHGNYQKVCLMRVLQ